MDEVEGTPAMKLEPKEKVTCWSKAMAGIFNLSQRGPKYRELY